MSIGSLIAPIYVLLDKNCGSCSETCISTVIFLYYAVYIN